MSEYSNQKTNPISHPWSLNWTPKTHRTKHDLHVKKKRDQRKKKHKEQQRHILPSPMADRDGPPRCSMLAFNQREREAGTGWEVWSSSILSTPGLPWRAAPVLLLVGRRQETG
jgi:hypothetical protein